MHNPADAVSPSLALDPSSPAWRHHRRAGFALLALLIMAVTNTGVWFAALGSRNGGVAFTLFNLLTPLQMIAGVVAIVEGIRSRRRGGPGILRAVLGVLGIVVSGAGWLGGLVLMAFGSGGAWGRPLRIRGRQLHPELRLGTDWTRGAEPKGAELDEASRLALEALWLHDAQKEHASVPAFARISWMLASVGAPPELHRQAVQAQIEEIDHAERCFALAAGYGGRRHTVEPMPELAVTGTGTVEDPLYTLVYESITDGCQLEDFNADVAGRCAVECEEPVTKAVLQQIEREERSHAEFSWRLVAWVLQVDPVRARRAIDRGLVDLANYPRPTAVSSAKRTLVDRADPHALRRHGRLPDREWAAAWEARLVKTRARIATLS